MSGSAGSVLRQLVCDILAAAPELDELTADRIARRLRERERPVSARAVADYLGLRKTDWVYANAERLGGHRLGDGEKARWRFYLSEVEEWLRDSGGRRKRVRQSQPQPKQRSPRRGRRGAGLTAAGNELLDFEAA
jgi:hypothetical protein